ncbi:MAG: nucleotidyltransferase domain-containing protein [Bacteroidetes bacterium]|nr:nucleotidyltransferase domain-containing protein [Bacteroidota bacterium]
MAKPLPDSINENVLCSVMSTILYFDLFKHPLKRDEIIEYTHFQSIVSTELDAALAFLQSNHMLYEKNGFYLPHQQYENIERRIKGNALADASWQQAIKKSILISRFPYVRSVVISGSLSKGYMDAESDIDFLIITEPKRLWLTRSLLAFYKKLFSSILTNCFV